MSSDWLAPFQLEVVELESCHLWPQFPARLRTKERVYYLDMSNADISDTMLGWLWFISSNLMILYQNNNQISRRLLRMLKFQNDNPFAIDLTTNFFDRMLPHFLSNVMTTIKYFIIRMYSSFSS